MGAFHRVLLAVSSVCFALPLWGQPVPVSPGGNANQHLATEACPTFHWGDGTEAVGYELVVYEAQGRDLAVFGDERAGESLALRELLPIGVRSWAPSLDRCLEPGGRYAWRVRAVEGEGNAAGVWSESRHFVVRPQSRLEQVLDRVVRRLVEEGELTEADAEQLDVWGLTGRTPEPDAAAGGGPLPAPLEQPLAAALATLEPAAQAAAQQAPGGSASAFTGDPGSAAFQVDGAGFDRGIYAEGDLIGTYGYATNPTGLTIGLTGQADSTAGLGVFGWVPAVNGTTYGVWGESESTSGYGVYGLADAATGITYGVFGRSDSVSGFGVWGEAAALTGVAYGVRGRSHSTSGRGVYGGATAVTGTTYGVFGLSASTSGRGVYGAASADTGTTYGVRGQSGSTSGRGVEGWASANTGTTYGVRGLASSTSGYDFYAAGNGTNYGPFTGGHEVRLAEGLDEVAPGLVVSVTGSTQVRQEQGAVNLSSTLPTVTLSSRAEDPAVFGVLVAESELAEDHWYRPPDGERFATVNALGEGRVWVTDANGPVRAGDYLTTSDVPGHAQRQDGDHLRSFTLGKSIETVDWDAVTETVEHERTVYKRVLLAVVYTSG